METWLRNNLTIVTTLEGEMIQWSNDVQTPLTWFLNKFTGNPTYTNLTTIDAGKMGFKNYFDELKTSGKLS